MTASSSRRPSRAGRHRRARSVNLVELSRLALPAGPRARAGPASPRRTSPSSTPPTPTWSPSSPAPRTSQTWSPGTRCCPRSRHSRAPPSCSTRSQIPGEIIDLMVVNTETLRTTRPSARRWSAPGTRRMAIMSRHGRGRHRRAHRHGRGLGHRPRRLRRAARLDRACSATPAEAVAFTDEPEAGRRPWTTCAPSPISKASSAWAASMDCGRHRLPRRQDAGRRRQRQAALRPSLHEDGGRRRALSRAVHDRACPA